MVFSTFDESPFVSQVFQINDFVIILVVRVVPKIHVNSQPRCVPSPYYECFSDSSWDERSECKKSHEHGLWKGRVDDLDSNYAIVAIVCGAGTWASRSSCTVMTASDARQVEHFETLEIHRPPEICLQWSTSVALCYPAVLLATLVWWAYNRRDAVTKGGDG